MFGSLDELLFRAFHGEDPGSPLTYVMLAFTALGSGYTMLLAVPLLLRARTRPFVLELVAAVAAVALVVFLLKLGVGRTRPYLGLPHVRVLYMVFAPPTDHSFPSGHAAGSFSTAAFLVFRWPERLGARSRLALFTLASAIALSRVYLGVHFPSDVLMGAVLGTVLGAAFGRGFRQRAERRRLRDGEASWTQERS